MGKIRACVKLYFIAEVRKYFNAQSFIRIFFIGNNQKFDMFKLYNEKTPEQSRKDCPSKK